jgi:hypothetical protein
MLTYEVHSSVREFYLAVKELFNGRYFVKLTEGLRTKTKFSYRLDNQVQLK